MADFGLAAFSVFFMQSPSFLEHQRHLAKERGRSNRETLFGMTKIPGDSQIRAKLDPIEPSQFHPMFDDVLDELKRSGGIEAFRRLGNHVPIALDGTQYHSSYNVRCDNCSTRRHGDDHLTAGLQNLLHRDLESLGSYSVTGWPMAERSHSCRFR